MTLFGPSKKDDSFDVTDKTLLHLMCLHHKICSCTTNYFSYITSLHMFFCNLKKWPFFRPPKKDLKIVFITLQVKKFFML
jgi:hypothetical protein